MEILIHKRNPRAKIPTRGSEYAAGYDLYACLDETVEIPPHQTRMISTGLSLSLPVGWFGAVFARSGLASKQGLRPANCVGVCDCDYRGDYTVALHNDTDQPRYINDGDRIAQLVIMPYMDADFTETEHLPESQRGEGGFGSTGY